MFLRQKINTKMARNAEPEHGIGLPHPAPTRPAPGSMTGEMHRPLIRQTQIIRAATLRHLLDRIPFTGTTKHNPIGAACRVSNKRPNFIGHRNRIGRWPEAVNHHQPTHEFWERARKPYPLTSAERVGHNPDRTGAEMTHEHGEVEVDQRPRKSGVERATVAVTTKVDRDRVIAEGRDSRRNLVEHASVVVGTVQQ